jgi:hypothetical protein
LVVLNFFLIVCLIVVWGGPIPRAIHDGWVGGASGPALRDRSGKCCGGELLGEIFKMTEDEEKRVRFLAIPATNCKMAASLIGLFSSSATNSLAAMNRGRLRRAFSSGADGCKEKFAFRV